MKIRVLKGKVLVDEIARGERNINGIIIPDDNGKGSGVRARWARVYGVGPDIIDIKEGDWILVQHGRWTREVKVSNELSVWGVEYPEGILGVSDNPEFETFAEDDIYNVPTLER